MGADKIDTPVLTSMLACCTLGTSSVVEGEWGMAMRLILGGRPTAALSMRAVLERSWQAARVQVRNHTVPLNVAAAAGLYLSLFPLADVAIAHVAGDDAFAALVRSYLRRVQAEERLASGQ